MLLTPSALAADGTLTEFSTVVVPAMRSEKNYNITKVNNINIRNS